MEWLWGVLGFGCLIGAGITIAFVDSATLGEHSGRFIAVVLAVSAYYGATSIDIPLNPVKFAFMSYAVPVLGVAGGFYCLWKIFETWPKEMQTVLNNGWKLMLVVVFALGTRFFLSL